MLKTNTSQIKRELWRLTSQISSRLSKATGKTIWHLSQKDSERLLKLLVWEERYSVPMEYIFQSLIPYCMRKLPKEVRRKLEAGKSLGVRISSLTSLECERYLKKTVEEEFPDGMNVRMFKEQRKQEALAVMFADDEPEPRRKILLKCKTIDAYISKYKRNLFAKRRMLRTLDKTMSRMPYRLNPWR